MVLLTETSARHSTRAFKTTLPTPRTRLTIPPAVFHWGGFQEHVQRSTTVPLNDRAPHRSNSLTHPRKFVNPYDVVRAHNDGPVLFGDRKRVVGWWRRTEYVTRRTKIGHGRWWGIRYIRVENGRCVLAGIPSGSSHSRILFVFACGIWERMYVIVIESSLR